MDAGMLSANWGQAGSGCSHFTRWPWPSVRRPRVCDAIGEGESSFIRPWQTDPPEAPRSMECQPRLEGAKSLVRHMATLELGLWGRVRAVGKSLNPLPPS